MTERLKDVTSFLFIYEASLRIKQKINILMVRRVQLPKKPNHITMAKENNYQAIDLWIGLGI